MDAAIVLDGEIPSTTVVVQADQTFVLDKARDLRYLVNLSSADAINLGCTLPPSSCLATAVLLPDSSYGVVEEKWLARTFEQYRQKDDVWQPPFLQGLIIATATADSTCLSKTTQAWLAKQGTRWIHFLQHSTACPDARPGPYIFANGAFRSVARLYKDTYKTFMLALDPAHQTEFIELQTSQHRNSVIDVAVPSRLKLKVAGKPPLDGIRVAVKDCFHLFGIGTSISNRSYLETYGKRQTTAACVKTLIERGCTVVGKVKMTAFGIWQEPVDYMDFEAPWNPRADGFQSPGGSSSGSSAASAAYDWLDIVMGADTAGSIMRPALWGGVFGLRPSFEAVSKEGIVPGIPTLDTPCFVGRDLRLCREFAAAWYGEKCQVREQSKTFRRIIWAEDYWEDIDTVQVMIAKKFAADLGVLLSAEVDIVSFKDDWAANPPAEAGGVGLQPWMATAVDDIWFVDYHNYDQFREDHMKKFGTAPSIDPFVQANWTAASKLSQTEYVEAFGRLSTFKQWFNRTYISGRSGVVFILPIEELSPRYRDQSATQITKPPAGVNSLWLSPVLGTPELIVPIDLISYQSRITHCEEFLPFAVGLMSDIGTDLALFDVAIAWSKSASRPTVVKTGKVPF